MPRREAAFRSSKSRFQSGGVEAAISSLSFQSSGRSVDILKSERSQEMAPVLTEMSLLKTVLGPSRIEFMSVGQR